jgi:hypothetical protein
MCLIVLESMMGPCKNANMQIVDKSEISQYLERDQINFSIVFFEDINSSFNVLEHRWYGYIQ